MTFRERLRKMMAGQTSAECPLPDCSTCVPSAPPLDVVAEQERALDLAYTAAWLVERWPDAWYFEDAHKLRKFAEGILALRLQVVTGRRTP